MQRLQAHVHGRVQGVGFREFVRREALMRRLSGYVRNSEDGRSVEVVAEGDAPQLEALVAALHEGPRFARVGRVDAITGDASGAFTDFRVEH